MFNIREYLNQTLKTHHTIDTIYWVGSGGSLIDMYPAHYMVNTESETLVSGWHTSKEFVITPPKRLGENCLTIVCSHSGNTQETVDAARLAAERGSAVLVLTDKAGSKIDKPEYPVYIYPWNDDVPAAQVPLGFCPLLAAELVLIKEGHFDHYESLQKGVVIIDDIIKYAKETVNKGMTDEFARMCKENPFFYILGSGPSFSQTYGFAICSMMEMQWQHCSYIHSAEYFHGPFEVTENGVFYFLQMSSGANRAMDERALAFLKSHTDRLMVLDTLNLGMDRIDHSVRDYLDPILLYTMNVEFRAARARLFNHPVESRRYMEIETY